MTQRRRLDAELVRRELAPSRRQATLLIQQHRVTVGGALSDNPSRMVSPAEPIEVIGPPPRFVGRGGEKLQAALDEFAIAVDGRVAIDIGASTGGFTDCLLQNGARRVVALDVGHGQLHERLRADERVDVRERTNVRDVSATDFVDAPFALIVIDVSFISLKTILPAVFDLAAVDGDIVALVKPQFEAGRQEVSKGKGVVRDPEVWIRVVEDVRAAMEAAGAATMGVMVSPLTGADGNAEFLGWFRVGKVSPDVTVDVRAVVDAVRSDQNEEQK